MTAFRFPLQKALEWRRKQLELEEVRLQRQLAALADLDRTRAQVAAAGLQAEVQVRGWNPVAGGDLAALGGFRLLVKQREKAIAGQRVECERQLAARQTAMLEARRRCRLLERLKERRLAEWQTLQEREMEELASECYLAQWGRRQARQA